MAVDREDRIRRLRRRFLDENNITMDSFFDSKLQSEMRDEADKQERVNNIKYYNEKKPTYNVYIVRRCKYFDPDSEEARR